MNDHVHDVAAAKLRRQPMLIGGEWVWAASGKSLIVENPGRRQPIAEVPAGGKEDVERAVKAALEAFDSWRKGRRATADACS